MILQASTVQVLLAVSEQPFECARTGPSFAYNVGQGQSSKGLLCPFESWYYRGAEVVIQSKRDLEIIQGKA